MEQTVLFTLDNYKVGGVCTFVQQYSSILVNNGYRVLILGRRGDLTKINSFFPKCKVFVIPEELKSGLLNRLLGFKTYYIYLSEIYRKYNISIIHFSLHWSTLYAMLHPKTWLLKRIITFYGAHFLEKESAMNNRNGAKKYINGLKKIPQLIAMNNSHKIVTFSNYARNIIINRFSRNLKKKILIVPGFIEDSKIRNLKSNSYKKKKNTYDVLNFGRAEPRKGIRLLIKATKKLAEKGIKIQAHIASPILYYQSYGDLKCYEKNNLLFIVQFTHALSEEQKEYFLRLSDVFVIPSIELETFGMTVIESLSKGVPVIGTPVGAIPNILSKVDSRLICNGASSKALADKLLWFHKLSTKQKVKLSQKATECVKKHYSQKVIGKKVLSIYR